MLDNIKLLCYYGIVNERNAMLVKINLHNEKVATAEEVARKHYTVSQLIAELKQLDPDAFVVAQDMLTNEYQAIDFRGVETVKGVA